MTYKNSGKNYKVESITYGGAFIQVNGTTITDQDLMGELTNNPYTCGGYSVFCDSNEIAFDTFQEAYDFATTKQKDTFSL